MSTGTLHSQTEAPEGSDLNRNAALQGPDVRPLRHSGPCLFPGQVAAESGLPDKDEDPGQIDFWPGYNIA